MVWVKSQSTVERVEVVKVEVVFAGTPILLTKLHFAEQPTLLPRHHSKEVKLVGYIQGPFFFRSCKFFHFA